LSHPEHRSVSCLAGELPCGVNLTADVLRRAIRDDFEKGRTESLNGWLLSKTEIRLFTLSALLSDSLI